MIRRAVVTLALLSMLEPASADRVVEQVERAVELSLAGLTLPAGEGSTVSFRECEGCPLSTHRLTDETELRANGQRLPLPEFLLAAGEIKGKPGGADNALAFVFLDIKTGRLTRIEVRE